MMLKTSPRAATIALLLLNAGCASTPEMQYYTLDMTPSGGAGGASVAIDNVSLSGAITRTNLAIQKTPTQIEYYATAVWAAALDEILTQKLRAEFGAPNGDDAFAAHFVFEYLGQEDAADGANALARAVVTGERVRYTMEDGDRVKNAAPAPEKVYSARVALGELSAAALAEGLSRAVEQVAAQVAAEPHAAAAP